MTGKATPLSEFLLREVRRDINLSTAEGRAALVLAAKPLLQKIAAPTLRLQLTREIAKLSEMSLADVERRSDLKPLARGRAAYVPQSRVTKSREYKLLQIILQRPEWVIRVPLELLSAERDETTALRAIAERVEHGTNVGGSGQILESFRGHHCEELIAQVLSEMTLEEPDMTTLEIVLGDALEQLRVQSLRSEIDARKKELSPEQWREILARKNSRRPAVE